MLRKVGVKAADGRDVAVQDGAVEPVVGEGRLGGDLSGGAYIYRYKRKEGVGWVLLCGQEEGGGGGHLHFPTQVASVVLDGVDSGSVAQSGAESSHKI